MSHAFGAHSYYWHTFCAGCQQDEIIIYTLPHVSCAQTLIARLLERQHMISRYDKRRTVMSEHRNHAKATEAMQEQPERMCYCIDRKTIARTLQ